MAPQQETKFNTSFIPKKPVSTNSGQVVKKSGGNIFSTIGLFLFILSLIGAAGVFLWKNQTQNAIDSQIEQLQLARREFDEQTIAAATRLNNKIEAVKHLLDNHVAPSTIFNILEESTLASVRFNNLRYSTTDSGTIDISGSGRALSFESVVLQSDELGNSDFRDVLFDNVQQNEAGDGVTFSMNASIDKNVVLYRNNIDGSIQQTNVFQEEEESASGLIDLQDENQHDFGEDDLESKDIFR